MELLQVRQGLGPRKTLAACFGTYCSDMAGGPEQNAIIVVQAGGEDNGVDYGLAEKCLCQARVPGKVWNCTADLIEESRFSTT